MKLQRTSRRDLDATPPNRAAVSCPQGARASLAEHGQRDPKRRAVADDRLDVDRAVVAAHARMDHREAEAGATVARLRREERLERTRERRRIPAAAGVGACVFDVRAGSEQLARERFLARDLD